MVAGLEFWPDYDMILGIVERVNLVWESGIAFFGSLWIELLLRYCS